MMKYLRHLRGGVGVHIQAVGGACARRDRRVSPEHSAWLAQLSCCSQASQDGLPGPEGPHFPDAVIGYSLHLPRPVSSGLWGIKQLHELRIPVLFKPKYALCLSFLVSEGWPSLGSSERRLLSLVLDSARACAELSCPGPDKTPASHWWSLRPDLVHAIGSIVNALWAPRAQVLVRTR